MSNNTIIFNDPERKHDCHGRLISIKYADGCAREYSYDDNGFMLCAIWHTPGKISHEHYRHYNGSSFRVMEDGRLQRVLN